MKESAEDCLTASEECVCVGGGGSDRRRGQEGRKALIMKFCPCAKVFLPVTVGE